MAFIQRLINLSIVLADDPKTNQPNSFAGTDSNTVTISGLRTSVRVQNSGNPALCTALVKVWGITPSLMNQLATLGLVWNLIPKNTITIQAGDMTSGMSTVFTGQITQAYGDYAAQPDVPFVFSCDLNGAFAATTVPPTSFPTSFDLATAMASFARQLNSSFVNDLTTPITLPSMYLTGSILDQIKKLMEAAHMAAWSLDANTITIWPRTGNKNTQSIPVVSVATGMVDYPAFTNNGIIVKTLFNPLLSVGGLVKVQSSLLSAIASVRPSIPNVANPSAPNETFPAQWAINKLDLALDSMLPHGDWLSIVYGYNPGQANKLIPPT